MKLRIGIDPGAGGAIAYRYGDDLVCTMNMPDTITDLWDELDALSNDEYNMMCALERVGSYVSGNSGPSAAKFARHCGNLEMALVGTKIPYVEVLPLKWQTEIIGKPNYPKIPKDAPNRKKILSDRKRDRKNKIKQTMQSLYPHIKVTLKNADALGILTYLERS